MALPNQRNFRQSDLVTIDLTADGVTDSLDISGINVDFTISFVNIRVIIKPRSTI